MYKLSKYRTELMGFAILWIFLFHSNIYIPEFLAPFKFVKAIGYSGVDIFFLLSGLGLSFSISKNTSLVQFYKKRLKRIIPTFWVCLFFISLKNIWVGKFHIKTFLLSIVGLDFLILQNTETWISYKNGFKSSSCQGLTRRKLSTIVNSLIRRPLNNWSTIKSIAQNSKFIDFLSGLTKLFNTCKQVKASCE